MKRLIILLGLTLTANTTFAQKESFWQVLAQVGFEHRKDKNGYDIEVPVFGKHLKTFNGKRVQLKGYMIPLEEAGGKGKFMLSSLPFNLCFFCGAAGPETVAEVETTEKIKFVTKPIVLEGILILNDHDPDHHMYILKSVTLAGE